MVRSPSTSRAASTTASGSGRRVPAREAASLTTYKRLQLSSRQWAQIVSELRAIDFLMAGYVRLRFIERFRFF